MQWVMVQEEYYPEPYERCLRSTYIMKFNETFRPVKDGIEKYYYTHGQINNHRLYSMGKDLGIIAEWYENGQKKFEGSNIDSRKKTGEWKGWYYTGQLKYFGTYDDSGQKTDLWEEWYPNGQQKSKIYFSTGIYCGEYTEWYDNEQLKTKGSYNDLGRKEGQWISWDEKGNIVEKGNYRNGNGKSYYANGDVKTVEEYYDAEIDHIYTEYYENGHIKWLKKYSKGKVFDGYLNHPTNAYKYEYPHSKFLMPPQNWYSNGIQEYINKKAEYLEYYYENKPKVKDSAGEYTEWFLNGNIKIKGYNVFHESGYWNQYTEYGVLESSRLWVTDNYWRKIQRGIDKRNKSWVYEETAYFRNGNIKSVGKYFSNDSEVRSISSWFKGEFVQKDPYKHKLGLWKYWDEDGHLIRKEQWNNGILISVDSTSLDKIKDN